MKDSKNRPRQDKAGKHQSVEAGKNKLSPQQGGQVGKAPKGEQGMPEQHQKDQRRRNESG